MNAWKNSLLVIGLCLVSLSLPAATEDPQQLVRETAEGVLAEVSKHESALRRDQSLIYDLVESTVVPHFDFQRMSQSAMGRFWRKATDAQKHQISEEFKLLLVRTYAVALLGYTGQPIEYQPMHTDPKSGRVTVPTRIRNNEGPPIPIHYRLYQREDGWKVYDVVIDGVSLVSNYRTSFTNQIRRGGIEGLIGRLQAQNSGQRG
ncbi:MAG: MlaC/ttg2D family ABC transporter substrate-binding protein [bacterium]